jgi:molybdate transport system ATP-binding protein
MLDADFEVERRDFTVRAALQVGPGERLALFGPSGAGKTTLLEVIAGLLQPNRGRVALRGRLLTSMSPPRCALPPWQRRVGLLRQDPGLFPHLSVMQNLTYSHEGEGAREAKDLADLLGVGNLLSAMPRRLSGGQAHRVALGRLLLAPCDALLLDEPYTGLDATLRRSLTDLVVSLVSKRDIPAVMVAHELADAQAFAHRLAVLDRGSILQLGTPGEVVRRPASRRAAELVGYLAFVPVREVSRMEVPGVGVNRNTGNSASHGARAADVTADLTGATEATAGVHPERVVAGADPDRGLVLAGKITACRPAGGGWEAELCSQGTTVFCRLPDKPGAVGDSFVITALDPPYFETGGDALRPPVAEAGRVEPTLVPEP